MSHYLVSGVAGFTGSRAAELLLDAGHTVAGLDNLDRAYDPLLKRKRLERLLDREGMTFVEGDLTETKALDELFAVAPADGVVHLAARAGVRASMATPRPYFETNVLGQLDLLEHMRNAGITKIVLASTSSLYAGEPAPFAETAQVNRPVSPYAASKKAAEVMAWTWHHLYQMDVSVVRFFTVYGPWGRPDMSILRFIHWIENGEALQLLGDGSIERDFTFIDDVARGTIKALRSVGYEVFNLGGGGTPVTMLSLIHRLERILGKEAHISFRDHHRTDMASTRADISKARELLDWQPQVDLDAGLAETVAWYRANASWLRDLDFGA